MSTNRFLRAVLPRTDRAVSLAVEAGQVICLARGVVDIEQCFTCPSYRSYQEVSPESLVCRPTGKSALAWAPIGFVPR